MPKRREVEVQLEAVWCFYLLTGTLEVYLPSVGLERQKYQTFDYG